MTACFAGLRYSVTVAPSAKVPKKKAGKEVSHRLPEAEDGWSTIAEAQNAAAARALFQVQRHADWPLCSQLNAEAGAWMLE